MVRASAKMCRRHLQIVTLPSNDVIAKNALRDLGLLFEGPKYEIFISLKW